MGMAIDSKKIVERLVNAEHKKNYNVTLTPSVMEAFKEACSKLGVKYSPVIEELLKEFTESSKKKQK